MAIPTWCHDGTALDLLRVARSQPKDPLPRQILAAWLQDNAVATGDEDSCDLSEALQKSFSTDKLVLLPRKTARRLRPFVGALQGWLHAGNFDQSDPVAMAWLCTAHTIPLGPGNLIEMVPVPAETGEDGPNQPFLISKTVITKRQWHGYLGRSLNSKQNPNHPARVVSERKVLDFCNMITVRGGMVVRVPTEKEWQHACWTTNKNYRDRLESSRLELEKHAWTRTNTPQLPDAIENRNFHSKFIMPEVCTKRPNPWGIFDMCGLVSQWQFNSYRNELVHESATSITINTPKGHMHLHDAPGSRGIRLVVFPEYPIQ